MKSDIHLLNTTNVVTVATFVAAFVSLLYLKLAPSFSVGLFLIIKHH